MEEMETLRSDLDEDQNENISRTLEEEKPELPGRRFRRRSKAIYTVSIYIYIPICIYSLAANLFISSCKLQL